MLKRIILKHSAKQRARRRREREATAAVDKFHAAQRLASRVRQAANRTRREMRHALILKRLAERLAKNDPTVDANP